jgi:hypothetical protein
MPGRRILPALVAALLAAAALPAGAGASDALTGRLLVTLGPARDKDDRDSGGPRTAEAARAARTARAARRLTAVAGARPGGRVIAELGVATVRPARGTSLAALRERLERRPGVADVRPERRLELRRVPNDPALTTLESAPGSPPGLPVQWWAERQGLFRAWDVFGGEGAKVAVIDTGIDASHPDLADRIDLAEDRDATPDAGPATVDESGHGTHVASLACGGGDNGLGLAGAGLNCRLLVFKSDLTEGSVAQSIVEAANAGAHAITMSFGTDGTQAASPAILAAVRYAYDRNVVMAAAAADVPVEEQGFRRTSCSRRARDPTWAGARPVGDRGQRRRPARVVRRPGLADLARRLRRAGTRAGGGPRGCLGAFPAAPALLERGRPGQPAASAAAHAHERRRRPPVRLPAGHLDGHADRRRGRRHGAGAQPRPQRPRRHPPAQGVRPPSRGAASGWEPELGWGILDAGAVLERARVLDRRAPVSRVRAAGRLRTARPLLRVTTLRDDAPPRIAPSGIARVELWRSVDRGRFRRVATTARGSRFRVTLRRGRRYAFHTIAVDVAGNRERAPRRADVVVRRGERR